ncbi:Crossover Junction Endonuclease Eme1 [Manis pentadactyla]|nr:Crossover Junction Endonuclease Eme1 [Manis pentadactyla]
MRCRREGTALPWRLATGPSDRTERWPAMGPARWGATTTVQRHHSGWRSRNAGAYSMPSFAYNMLRDSRL